MRRIGKYCIPAAVFVLALCFLTRAGCEPAIATEYRMDRLHAGSRYMLVSTLCTGSEEEYGPVRICGHDMSVIKSFTAGGGRETVDIEYPVSVEDLEKVLSQGESGLYIKTVLYENGVKVEEKLEKDRFRFVNCLRSEESGSSRNG